MNESRADDAQIVAGGLKSWVTFKKSCGGNYSYRIQFTSAFGFGQATTITVQNNRVVGRKFDSMTPPLDPTEGNLNSWEENFEALGSHNEGAPPKTIDELYANVTQIASQKLTEAEERFVRLDKQGLISSCFIVNRLISDDAPKHGIDLAYIRADTTKTASSADEEPDPGAVRNLKYYASSVNGLKRHVILLPNKKRGDDDNFLVELIVGKTMQTDGVNRVRLMGEITEETLKGFGFPYYQIAAFGGAASTRIGVPAGRKPVASFVEIPRRVIKYNSRLPIVVYAPADSVVKYRVYSADETKTAEKR